MRRSCRCIERIPRPDCPSHRYSLPLPCRAHLNRYFQATQKPPAHRSKPFPNRPPRLRLGSDRIASSARNTSESRIPAAGANAFAQRKQLFRGSHRIYGADCAGTSTGISGRTGRSFVRHRPGSSGCSCHRRTGTYCVRRPTQQNGTGCFGRFGRIAAEPHDAACAACTAGSAAGKVNAKCRCRLSSCDAGRAAATDRCIDIWTTDTAHSGTDHTASSSAAAVAYGKGTNASHAGSIACIGRRRQPTCGFPGCACVGSSSRCIPVSA